jgi:PIF1-like helicase
MQNDNPFGEIPFLGVGDFRQVAPVVKGSGCTSARLACVTSSALWTQFVILSLHAPIRSARDPLYTAFVDRIGEDYVHPSVSLDLLATLPSVTDCIDFLYPPDILLDPLACLKRAFLSPKNIPVDDFNIKVLDRLPGEECMLVSTLLWQLFLTPPLRSIDMFYSTDSIKEDSDAPEDELRPDFLAVLTHTGVPPHLLRLKRGCVCSIMRNLSVRKGLVKNARVFVHSLHRLFVQVQVINNRDGLLGTVHCIPQIRFEFNPPYSS